MSLTALTMGAYQEARVHGQEGVDLISAEDPLAFSLNICLCKTWIHDRHASGLRWAESAIDALLAYRLRLPADDLALGKSLHLLGIIERIYRAAGRAAEFGKRLEAAREKLPSAGYLAAERWYFDAPVERPVARGPVDLQTWSWHPRHPEAECSIQADSLVLASAPLRGFYQLDMPRLTCRISGDFVFQATVHSGREVEDSLVRCRQNAAAGRMTDRARGGGGILVTRNRRDALRLFAHIREPGDIICTVRENEQDRFLGRGMAPDSPIRLRLERQGKRFMAYAGGVDDTWYPCGAVDLSGWDAEVEVGVYAECLVDLYSIVRRAETHFSGLVLDEIGEATPALQASLLRVIEERAVRRLGDTRLRELDIRIVAATNAPLEKKIGTDGFRQDLFYRLAGHRIDLPPLRQRREEIPALVYHFLDQWSARRKREGARFAQKTMDLLTGYDWPGNVRQLIHEVERAAAEADGRHVEPAHLSIGAESVDANAPAGEIQRLRDMLRLCNGNQSEAARRLGIDRSTLYRRMRRFGIQPPGRT